MNYLATFNEFERAKILPNRLTYRTDPGDDNVAQGGIWVAEFFPPSQYRALVRQLNKNGWDRGGIFSATGRSNVQAVDRARTRQGFLWSSLGTVVSPSANFLHPSAKRETLPAPFSQVDISAVQIGSSLTAVVAFFRFTDVGSSMLNRTWHQEPEPKLVWQGFRPQVQDRRARALRFPREERQRLHDEARGWFSAQCAGFFSGTQFKQPVVDLNVFKYYDPEIGGGVGRASETYRSLGMQEMWKRVWVSEEAPGISFVLPNGGFPSDDGLLENCWGGVGSYDRLLELNYQSGYGDKPWQASTFAGVLDDEIRSFLLYMTALAYLDEMRARYATSRDLARTNHGRYRLSKIKKLRSELLTTSLDLSVVAKDVGSLWEGPLRHSIGISLVEKDAHDRSVGAQQEDVDLVEAFNEHYRRGVDKLVLEDAAYRDVLVTVASLGTSAETSRLGRAALFVSGVSLIVAAASLLVAETGGATSWSDLFLWIQR